MEAALNIQEVEIPAVFPKKLRPLFTPSRYKILKGGRGGAKSWGIARALLLMGMEDPLRVLCARQFQKSIKDSVHRLLKQQIELMGLDWFYDVTDTSIKGANGTIFGFEGLERNINNIRSWEGATHCWVEEAHTVTDTSWEILIPTIREENSEIWLSFNPEFEDDPTFERFVENPPENSILIDIGYKDNPWFPKVLEQERLELLKKDPDAHDHVWGGKCRKWVTGAIYAEEIRAAYDEGRIRLVEHDPNLKVFTAWDLGHTDDTAILWFQVVGGEIHIIECYARSGGSLSHFASQILGKKVAINLIVDNEDDKNSEIKVVFGDDIEGLEHRRAYDYETHWLPHDAKAKVLTASGKTTQQQLKKALGFGNIRITPNITVTDGIKAVRSVFPMLYFDKDGCLEFLKAIRKYQREKQTDDKSLKKNPKHDWTSHYADALRYLSIVWDIPHAVFEEPEDETDAWGNPVIEDDWKVN